MNITTLDNPQYRLRKPIPFVFHRGSLGGVEASFDEADIGAVGFDEIDALELLTGEILAIFELGLQGHPDRQKQLQTLREYIERA